MKIACKGYGLEDAKVLAKKLKYKGDFKEFLFGLNVEGEHRVLTGGDLEKTAMIGLVHLSEKKNYYMDGYRKGFFDKKELGIE
jgi:hypothetical protein